MYQNMMFGVKRRILDEVERAFENHPAFSAKVEVKNKFPYQERIQYGVILRNTAASTIRMSADNYMGDIHSHVRLAKQRTAKNVSIEWVKESEALLTDTFTEDLSPQVDPTQRLLYTTCPMTAGPGNTKYADNPGQVVIKINENQIYAEFIDGKNRKILLPSAPDAGSTISVTYSKKILADAGIYMAKFNSEKDFSIFPTFEINDEILFERTNGLETSVVLQRHPIGKESELIFLNFLNIPLGENAILLKRGIDYTIDKTTGLVTFLTPVPANFIMTANYYTEVYAERGPYTFKPYQEVHDVISGVALCMGRRAIKDDTQLIIVTKDQEPQARIFGGHWEMSLSLGVISKDSVQMEEMTDQIVNWLWGVRKNTLELEGITFNRVEPTGESEETFIESTGDLYYESSIDISVMTEWQKFIPYIYSIRAFDIHLNTFAPYLDTVIKGPTISYERVS